MKYVLTLLLTTSISCTFAQNEIKLQTDEQKYAYYSPFALLDYHKQAQLPIEEELMLRAAMDALNGKASKVANEDMKALDDRMGKKWDRQHKWDRRKDIPPDASKWTDEEKFAYHSVYSRIVQWKKKEWFDKDIILQSAKDAFGGKINRLEKENIGYLLSRIQVKTAIAENFGGNILEKRNWEAGLAYQKANKKKKGVVVTASGLQYRVIKKGMGKQPSVMDTVSITYKMTSIKGKVIGRSKKPMELKVLEMRTKPKELKVADLVQGWAEGLQLMKVGAKYELVIPPDIGQGMMTLQTVIIEVELVDIVKQKEEKK